MALELCSDLSAAAWLERSDEPWSVLTTFGPSGYPSYARLRFLPDPAFEGQPEGDADFDRAPYNTNQWPVLLEHLASHTHTPDDCFFCLWDGWAEVQRTRLGPKLGIPGGSDPPIRGYFVFHGSLSDFGLWGPPDIWPEEPPTHEPAFIWPADHKWCVANDVDPHYAGVSGQHQLTEQLARDQRLDVVDADPRLDQPVYRV
jgi:hypothetical protein